MKKKIYEPKYDNGVQKPGKIAGFITKYLIIIDVILLILLVSGAMGKDSEVTFVTGGLIIFVFAIILLLKHSYNTSYQENHEYFIINIGKKEHKIKYENIENWKPTFNEISVLDKTNIKNEYVRVNIVLFKPEILLRTLADMTFNGNFRRSLDGNLEDLYRKEEIVAYLYNNKYGYLIEDYIEKVKDHSNT